MRLLKLLSMAIGFLLAWYFAGPIVAEMARNAFELYYIWQYGAIPSFWSLEYYFTFMPMRGHVTYYAYLYGHQLCALIVAPLFYKLPDMIATCFKSEAEEPKETVYSPYENRTEAPCYEDVVDKCYPAYLINRMAQPSVNEESMQGAYPAYRLR